MTNTIKGQENWLLGAAILASTYKDCKGFSNSILKHWIIQKGKGRERVGKEDPTILNMDFKYLPHTTLCPLEAAIFTC
jgi:hypothetical protein